MSTPRDQQIIDALVVLLKTITVANGYRTNAGLYVFDEESRDDVPDDVIATEIIDTDETLRAQNRKEREADLRIRIDALVPWETTPKPRAAARNALADYRQAIATINQPPGWIKGVTNVALGGRRIPPRVEGSAYVEASLDVQVTYIETHTRSN